MAERSTKRNRKYTGDVGEHYVLYRLIREEYNAVLASPNTDAVDIYVADKAGKPFAVQVKTKANSSDWRMLKKHEEIEDSRLFYAFVDLGKNADREPPNVFIVPSSVVSRVVRDSHQAWLSTPARKGSTRKDGDLRAILPTYPRRRFGELKGLNEDWLEQYRENWQIFRGL